MLKGVIVLFVPYGRNKRHIDIIENNYPKLLPYIDTLFGYKDMLHSVHTNIKYMDKMYKFAINGQTGKVVGEYPVDNGKKWKYFAKVAGIAYVAAAVVGWLLLH